MTRPPWRSRTADVEAVTALRESLLSECRAASQEGWKAHAPESQCWERRTTTTLVIHSIGTGCYNGLKNAKSRRAYHKADCTRHNTDILDRKLNKMIQSRDSSLYATLTISQTSTIPSTLGDHYMLMTTSFFAIVRGKCQLPIYTFGCMYLWMYLNVCICKCMDIWLCVCVCICCSSETYVKV